MQVLSYSIQSGSQRRSEFEEKISKIRSDLKELAENFGIFQEFTLISNEESPVVLDRQ